MKLSIRGIAGAAAVTWGGAILIVGMINLAVPGYGQAFLELCDSIYPGFDNNHTFGAILIGTGYGLVDGAICGTVFAWIYNFFGFTKEQ